MIDMVLGVIILVSALLGLLRGFVAIVVGTLSWLLAGWATFMFGGATAHWLADGKHPLPPNRSAVTRWCSSAC